MTNVPQNLREMWSDIYKLFDLNYLMENNLESWNKFLEQANRIYEKYKTACPKVLDMIIIVSELIEERMNEV